jgi:uncharacterized protein (TIGR02452 family)
MEIVANSHIFILINHIHDQLKKNSLQEYKIKNIQILLNTIQKILQLNIVIYSAIRQKMPNIIYFNIPKYHRFENTYITVLNNYTDDTARAYKADCMLNLGNAYRAGGGCIVGQIAQEEAICRSSTLLLSLYPLYLDLDNDKSKYINDEEVLYSQKVQIIKNSQYEHLSNPYEINVITACAVRYYEIKNYTPEDEKKMYNLIYNILYTAYIYGNKRLVLGALGCGAFNNNPEQCATIFKNVIKQFDKCFDHIYFAVLSFGNNQNFNIFNKILND